MTGPLRSESIDPREVPNFTVSIGDGECITTDSLLDIIDALEREIHAMFACGGHRVLQCPAYVTARVLLEKVGRR